MTAHLVVAAEDVEAVADALTTTASLHRRSVDGASVELIAQKRAGGDVRTQSMRLLEVLARATTLETYADALRTGSTRPDHVPNMTPGGIPAESSDAPPLTGDARTDETLANLTRGQAAAPTRSPDPDAPPPDDLPDATAALDASLQEGTS